MGAQLPMRGDVMLARSTLVYKLAKGCQPRYEC